MTDKNMKRFLNSIVFLGMFQPVVISQQWQPVPMVSREIKDAGFFGGEGLQWPQALEIDQLDGSFILYGTDVGGILRSTDGGKTFEPASVGYNARGNCGFAIDPKNNTRAVAVAGNSGENPQHGIYLTTDQGATWTHVLPFGDYNGYRDIRDQIVYDPSSFDPEQGFCTVIYWSKTDENNAGGLFRSLDGGSTWEKMTSDYAASVVKVHPETGWLYVANGNLYCSRDSGSTFERLEPGVTDIDVILTQPDHIYALKNDGLYVSSNNGADFTKVVSSSFPSTGPYGITVCPDRPDSMIMANYVGTYNRPRYYSHDGGKTWSKSGIDNTLAWGAYNARPPVFRWAHDGSHALWSFGGAWATRSTDGGKTFEWYANGINLVMVGGLFNFNPAAPDNIFFGFQDQNAGFSTNGGYTFKYCNVSGLGWGGHCYGSFAVDDKTLLTGLASAWGAPRELRISLDGGNTWNAPGVTNGGLDVVYGDPADSSVLFFGNYRSTDRGKTWSEMPECLGVCTSSPVKDRELYGVFQNTVVRSFDHGMSWEIIAAMDGNIRDVAYDHIRNRLYVAMGNDGLSMVDCVTGVVTDLTNDVARDQYNSSFRPNTVAVDPVQPEVVYAGQSRGSYKTDVSVIRSVNAGESWTVINRNKRMDNTQFGMPGAQEAKCVRVHPVTRELWVGTGCYGFWKIAPPDHTQPGLPVVDLYIPEKEEHIIINDTTLMQVRIYNDTGVVDKVNIFVNDHNTAETNSAFFEYPWLTANQGVYEVYARMTDTSGNVYDSEHLNLTIYPSSLPVVSVTAPGEGSEFAYHSDIEIRADASDSDGTITKVEFYHDRTKIGEDSSVPFSCTWENVPDGNWSLSAKATDNTGQTVTSLPVLITVLEKEPDPVYQEDFNDGLAQDWTPLAGTWTVENNEYHNFTYSDEENCLYSGSKFGTYTLSVKARSEGSNFFGLIFNYVDQNNYYFLIMDNYPTMIVLKKKKNGNEAVLASSSYMSNGTGQFEYIQIRNDSTSTSVTVNGTPVFNHVSTADFPNGQIGFYTRMNAVVFDDVLVYADWTEELLNSVDRNNDGVLFEVYPNPLTVGNLTIGISSRLTDAWLRIYDSTGRMVYFDRGVKNQFTVPGADLKNPGLYTINLTNGKRSFKRKILVVR